MKERNVIEEALKGKKAISVQKDLKASEMEKIYELFKEKRKTECEGAALYDLITNTFYFGFSAGIK